MQLVCMQVEESLVVFVCKCVNSCLQEGEYGGSWSTRRTTGTLADSRLSIGVYKHWEVDVFVWKCLFQTKSEKKCVMWCDLTRIELKVIEQFVQITNSCLEEAVHAGQRQRALCPSNTCKVTKSFDVRLNKGKLFLKWFHLYQLLGWQGKKFPHAAAVAFILKVYSLSLTTGRQ